MWDSEDPSIFKIMWLHKAKSSWTSKDAAVFIAWDRLKNRPPPTTPADYVNSKQRLRAALRNMRTIEEVSATDGYRKYRIKDMQDIQATRCALKENKIKREFKSEIPEHFQDVQGTYTCKEKEIEREIPEAKPSYSFWQNADVEKKPPKPEPQPSSSNDEKKPPVPKLVVAFKGKGYVCLPGKNKSPPPETEVLDELLLAPKRACLRSYKNKIQAEVADYPPPKKAKIETNAIFNKEIKIKFENPATTVKEAAHSSAGTVLDEKKENKTTARRAKRNNSNRRQEIPLQRPQHSATQQLQKPICERPQQSAHQRPQQSASQRPQKSIYERPQQSTHQRSQQFKGPIKWPESPSYVETNPYLKNPFELFDQNQCEDLNFEEDENNVPRYFYNSALSLDEILTVWVDRKMETEFLETVPEIPVEVSKEIRVDYM